MSRVLVTGAAGFAGSHLVEELVSTGTQVIAWRRPPADAGSSSNGWSTDSPLVRWQDVDLLDRAGVVRAIAETRPDDVYHCAGAAHVGRSWENTSEALATNALGTHHLLSALRDAGLDSRILIPGSAMVYRQSDAALSEDHPVGPASPYALSKLAQEMVGRQSASEDGQRVYLTRSFNHTGPRQEPSYAASAFARQIALIEAGQTSPSILVGNLEAERDLHDVRDTVRAYRDICEKGRPGVIYNVCAGRAFKIRDVLDCLVAQSRVAVTVAVDSSRYRPNDTPVVLGDFSRLRKETGWAPRIDLEETLRDLLEYWRKEVE